MAVIGSIDYSVNARTADFERGMAGATASLDAFSAKLDELIVKAGLADAALNKLGGHIGSSSSTVRKVAKDVEQLELPLKGVATEALNVERDVSRATKVLSALGSAGSSVIRSMGDVNSSISKVANGAAQAAGGGIGALGGALSNIPIIGGILSGPFAALSGLIGALGESAEFTWPVLLVLAAAAVALAGATAFAGISVGVFAAALVGAAIIVGTTTVAVGGLFAVVGGGIGLLLGLGAASVLLANQAGTIDKQMAKATDTLKALGKEIGEDLTPAARVMLGIFNDLAPIAQSAIKPLADSFNTLLTAARPLLTTIGTEMITDFLRLSNIFLQLAGYVVAHPELVNFLQYLATQGIAAVQGLVTNLENLATWITAHQAMLQQTGTIFSDIGRFVQWLAGVLSDLATWFSTHWPQILAAVGFLRDEWSAFYTAVKPWLDTLIADIEHFAADKDALDGLGKAITAFRVVAEVAFNAVAAIIDTTIRVVQGLADVISYVFSTRMPDDVAAGINKVISAINAFVTNAGGALSVLGINIPVIGLVGGPGFAQNYQPHAAGGYFDTPHLGMVGEAGGEWVIPMTGGVNAVNMWAAAGRQLGLSGSYSTAAALSRQQAGAGGGDLLAEVKAMRSEITQLRKRSFGNVTVNAQGQGQVDTRKLVRDIDWWARTGAV